MKKLIKIIIGIILALIVLIIAGLVILYINMKDDTNNTNQQIIENNISLNDAVSKQLALALDNTKETGKAEISLSEYDLNEIAYACSQIIPSTSFFEVLSCYLELDEENYYLNIPMKVAGRQTLVRGKITLDIDQEKFGIGLKEISIGKLSFKSFIVKTVLNFFKSKLETLGVTLTSTDDQVQASITRVKIGELIKEKLKDNEYGGIIKALFNVFFIDNDCFIFHVNNPLDVKLTVDLSMFGGKSSNSLDLIKDDVKTILDSNKLAIKDVPTAVLYYAAGYNHLSDESKNKVDEVFKDIYDPVTLKSNSGYINRTPATMQEIIVSQALTAKTKGINITDDNLTTVFSNLNLLGLGAGFATYDTHKVAYIVLDAFEAFIQNDYLKLSLDININGYKVTISCEFNVPEKNDYSVEATLTNMSIGVKSIGDNKDDIFNFLADNISSEEWIRRSDKPNTLIFDFKSFFSGNEALNLLLSTAKVVKTKLYENTDPTSGGYINIHLGF